MVTSFEFALRPVDDVYVGLFFYELDHAGTLLRFYRDFAPKTPPESVRVLPSASEIRSSAALHTCLEARG